MQNHENGRRRKYKTHESEHDFEDYVSSTNNSNSLLSSTESSSNDSYTDYFNANKKRKLNHQQSANNDNRNEATCAPSSSTNGLFEATPDSGISGIAEDTLLTPNSSNSRGTSFDVMKKIDAVKRNYRKNMITSDDSD